MQNLAPIVLFCYNRPDHAAKTLEALSQNDLAAESILYIFCDGAKPDATAEQIEKIQKTRAVAKSKQWCKEVYIKERDTNIGLADSIIEGVTAIVNQYGKVIVLEDDIVTSCGFLKYMNDALELYENNEKVMHISGYMYPHQEKLPETFFYRVTMCWGWATWKRAWMNYNNNALELWEKLLQKKDCVDFDKFGGNYLSNQLFLNIEGDLKTWFIKWNTSVYLIDGLTLFPNKSLVDNIGHDGSGENCVTDNRFENSTTDYISVFPIEVVENKSVKNIISTFLYPPPFDNKKRIKSKIFSLIKENRLIVTFLEKFSNYIYEKMSIKLEKFVNRQIIRKSFISKKAKIYGKASITLSIVQKYTYIATNCTVSHTTIGKFCSIGTNFICGWGIHPTNGISTAPMFYSTLKQNGMTLSSSDKIEERKKISIGNDVFIGMNVTVLDGVTIGDGAIIGAGAIVSKDIPPYAVAVGNPIRIIKYRFDDNIIQELLALQWWNLPKDHLTLVEQYFWDINTFIEKTKELKK